MGEHVAQEVHSTPLPGGPDQHGVNGTAQSGMGIGDDQLDSGQTAGFQRPQKRGPERPVLGVSDLKAQYLAAPVSGHPGGDDHRLRHHPMIHPGLAVGGVEEDIRKALITQRPVPEGRDLGVEVFADPADLAFGDPGIGTQCLDQIVDLAGGGAVQVGLHHHREQALIDPATPLQQGNVPGRGVNSGGVSVEAPWVSRRLGLLDSDQGLVGPVCIVERGFELRGWDVAEVAVQAAGVVPVDPTEGGEFYVLDGLPRSASSRPVDQLGLVVTVDCLRESVIETISNGPN